MYNKSDNLLAILGPTNTGKTHFAFEKLFTYSSGIFGFPLRLLARENYDKAVKKIGINNVALIDGEPKLLNLKSILSVFFNHRKEVVSRRTFFDLRKAKERGHILEGLTIALANIDEMIELIKKSKEGSEAKKKLLSKKWKPGKIIAMLEKAGPDACKIDVTDTSVGLIGKTYQLSEQQAQAILDMRLQRLTGLEQDKLIKEYEEIIEHIAYLLEILGDSDRLIEVVKDELKEVQEKYKDDRRTEIQDSAADLTEADLITPERFLSCIDLPFINKCC